MFLSVMNVTKKAVLNLAVVLVVGLGTGIPVAAQTVVIEDGLIGYWSFRYRHCKRQYGTGYLGQPRCRDDRETSNRRR